MHQRLDTFSKASRRRPSDRWRPRRGVLTLIVLMACAGLFVYGLFHRQHHKSPPRVVILGIDGMDYALTQKLMREGRLPNLAKLAQDGAFLPSQTSMPPLSPVAWSNFITGMNPGGHGVFDFLRRDPAEAGAGLLPQDSVTDTPSASPSSQWRIPFTDYVWPTLPQSHLLRHGPALWELLQAHGIPCTIYKVPANFPAGEGQAQVLAGMGTPDIEGTYGLFTYLTDRPSDWDKPASGGYVLKVKVQDGQVRLIDSGGEQLFLHGPVNPFRAPNESNERRRVDVPFEVYVDPEHKTAVVRLQGQDTILKEGEWSPWVHVTFKLLPAVKSLHGLVRFHLQEASPHLRLFVSPVNLAPGTEGLASGGLDTALNDELGPYYTKGMSEQTKALLEGLFTTDEYLQQSNLVFQDGLNALDYILAHTRSGFQFIYFSTLDLTCHVLWKDQDPHHPAYDPIQSPAYANSITDLYIRLDRVVGHVRQQLHPDDILYVMSDHGFGPIYREFNIDAWLADQGYLVYKSSVSREVKDFSDVDWSRTRAYGLGFQSLYINRQGREAHGIVAPGEYDALVEEIRYKLLAYRDPGGKFLKGHSIFHAVYRPQEIYSGAMADQAPDLVLGYDRGYGPADDAVLGVSKGRIVADRLHGFSGHHANDFTLVPGVFFSSQKLRGDHIRLEDITVTVLKDYGIPPAPAMTGRAIQSE